MYTLKDLPREVYKGDHWQSLYILALYKWLGVLENLWTTPSMETFQTILNAVYLDPQFGTPFSYKIWHNNPVHYLVHLQIPLVSLLT